MSRSPADPSVPSGRRDGSPGTVTISSEELAGLLLESTGEGIYGVDSAGNCTFANPACLRLLGFSSEEELLGRHMHPLVHHTRPDGTPYPVEECRIYEALRDRDGVHVDDELMFRADGSSFPAEYWSYPMIRDGRLVGSVVTFVDITERVRRDEELRAAEERVRLLLMSTGEGIYGVDADGHCTFANPACLRLLGFGDEADLLGRHVHPLVHHTRPDGSPYPVEECRIYAALRERQGTHVDDELMFRADGSSFPAEYWSYPIVHDGELVGAVVTFVDITERVTQERLLAAERERSERLLLSILPAPIADRLKASDDIIADASTDVTVLFADLVGFTAAAATMSPQRVVRMLNEVFTTFDELVDEHDLEKIKTIGDGYMVAGGIPEPRPDHAVAVAELALAMQRAMSELARAAGVDLRLRVGIATGPVVAGVIGRRRFSYDLWGDTVNTASRMEAFAPVGAIQVTERTHRLLRSRYRFERREDVPIKGKGNMTTYVLTGPTHGAEPAA